MKLKVIKRYVDRYTKQILEEGAEINAEDVRAEELLAQNVVEAVKEEKLDVKMKTAEKQ